MEVGERVNGSMRRNPWWKGFSKRVEHSHVNRSFSLDTCQRSLPCSVVGPLVPLKSLGSKRRRTTPGECRFNHHPSQRYFPGFYYATSGFGRNEIYESRGRET
jgi:hypothetical protein